MCAEILTEGKQVPVLLNRRTHTNPAGPGLCQTSMHQHHTHAYLSVPTEEPAQKGHEFRMEGELLRDRAPKDSATMEPPSSSCNKPSESSGRPGSSSREGREEADHPRGRFL